MALPEVHLQYPEGRGLPLIATARILFRWKHVKGHTMLQGSFTRGRSFTHKCSRHSEATTTTTTTTTKSLSISMRMQCSIEPSHHLLSAAGDTETWHWRLRCGGCIPAQCATQQPDSSCLCRRDILEKVLEQFLHWYFFTSEWVWRWALRLDLSAKALLQCGQEKGFSPGGWGDKTEQVSIQMPPRNIASVKASRGITKTCQVNFFFFWTGYECAMFYTKASWKRLH